MNEAHRIPATRAAPDGRGTGGRPSVRDAVELHRAGRLAEAIAIYRAALAAKPGDAQVLQLMGVALLQQGDAAAACDAIGRAVAANPGVADWQDSYGSALRAAGRAGDAVAAHRRAIALNPQHAGAHFNLGNALTDAAAPRSAAEAYRAALTLQPGHARARFNLANTLQTLGDAAGAEAEYRRALADNPGYAEAWNNLGGLLAARGDLIEAEAAYGKALALRPTHPATLGNLGNVLHQLGRYADAEALHQEAVRLDPSQPDAWNHLGVVLHAQDRPAEAAEAYRAGLRLRPDDAKALANLAGSLELLGDLTGAEDALRRAVALAPDFAEAYGNMALCHLARGDEGQAERDLDRALTLDPGLPQARLTRGMLRLRQGRMQEGWEDYRWRFAAGEALPHRRFDAPEWTGEPAPDKSLLIWREQGIGDEIMFASLYRDALARVGRVTIECEARLAGLFARSFPTAQIRPERRAAPEQMEQAGADLHCPAGSLPGVLNAAPGRFRADPFLVPDPDRVAVWARRLGELPPGLRVGIAWRSTLITTRRRGNYVGLDQWAPLLRMPGVRFISLQPGAVAAEIRDAERAQGIVLHRWPDLDLKNDLEGLAALAANLDLVITAPVAVGEMAAAVGTPAWRLTGRDDWTCLGTAARPWFGCQSPLFAGAGGMAQAPALAARRLAAILAGSPSETDGRAGLLPD